MAVNGAAVLWPTKYMYAYCSKQMLNQTNKPKLKTNMTVVECA